MIVKIVVHKLDFVGDSTFQDHKKYCELISLDWSTRKTFGLPK